MCRRCWCCSAISQVADDQTNDEDWQLHYSNRTVTVLAYDVHQARDTRANTVGRHWRQTMLAVIFVGRQCWPVCRGSRQCRPTNLTFDFTYSLFFLPFFSAKLCHFVVKFPTFLAGRRAIQSAVSWSNMIDFSCADFSLLVSMSLIAAIVVSLLKFCVFSSFLYSTKIRRNDKYFFLFKIFFWLLSDPDSLANWQVVRVRNLFVLYCLPTT